MKRLVLLVVLVGCANPERELAQCKAISTIGDALMQCLILHHDWDAADASREQLRYDLNISRNISRERWLARQRQAIAESTAIARETAYRVCEAQRALGVASPPCLAP